MSKIKQSILDHGNMIRTGAVAGALTVPLLSHAALDLSGITEAGAEAGTVAAAIGAVMVAIWAAKLVYRKFFGG